ncbi:MAG TPA: sigma-70 family RNA polymerase sigma factor [Ilumatobacteraceae bacterium]|jgi:RNA polymerase sigma-B factor
MAHGERSGRRVVDAKTVDGWCAEYYATRDKGLRDSIVKAHQWLVVLCARRMVRRREPFDDLMQVGNIGLLKAIDRFDPAYGVSFHTFASATIIGELRRHYRTVWQVRVPRSLQERYVLVNTAVDDLTNDLRRSPTPQEVADHLRIGLTEVIEALSIGSAMWVSSLSPTEDADGVRESTAMAVTDGSLDATNERLAVVSLLQSLPPLQRTVLVMSFCQEMKQSDIGERLGMSQLQVSRLIRRAIRSLRIMLETGEARNRHDLRPSRAVAAT